MSVLVRRWLLLILSGGGRGRVGLIALLGALLDRGLELAEFAFQVAIGCADRRLRLRGLLCLFQRFLRIGNLLLGCPLDLFSELLKMLSRFGVLQSLLVPSSAGDIAAGFVGGLADGRLLLGGLREGRVGRGRLWRRARRRRVGWRGR